MNLKLHKPLCIFDLETTGINISKDKIIEICILKVFPDASRESKTWYVNPEMPIPAESTAVHGITDEDVKDSPTFKELAPKIIDMIKDSDLGGFNSNRFDIPLLAEELLRAGYDFDLSKHKPVDAQTIFHKMEPRNLAAAFKFYCEKELVNAHTAEADVTATYEILESQLTRYTDIKPDINSLHEFCNTTKNVDLAGRIVYDDKKREVFNFGKYKGRLVTDVFKTDPSYYDWMLKGDFSRDTKQVVTALRLREREN